MLPVLLLGLASQAVDTTHSARLQRALSGIPTAVVVRGEAPEHSTVEQRLSKYKVPGVSIAVAQGGRIVWAAGLGVKTSDGTDQVTPETLFQAASISKPIAVTAMLRLVEQGTLDLDTDVNRYLRSWQLPVNRFTAETPVTLRRIVSHSAGLTVHGFPGYRRPDSLPTVPQILDGVSPANTAPVRADTTPGAIERYSGGGTTVMQLLLEDVTGRSFPDLLRELVLEPAQMTRSAYAQPLPPGFHQEAAAGHFGSGSALPVRWHTYPELAAAGLWTTPSDLLRWAIAITESWQGKSSSLLSQATARSMLTRVKTGFGLGPALAGEGDAFRFGHGGANAGYRCVIWYFPARDMGVAVMTNGDAGGLVAEGILRTIALEYRWPAFQPREVSSVTLDEKAQAALAGEYRGPRGGILTVKFENGRAFAEAPGILPRERLAAISPLTLVGIDSGVEINFRLEGDRAASARLAGGPEMQRSR